MAWLSYAIIVNNSRFHSEANEPVLGHAVMPPLRDDVQLSVDDYRNKLYELMASGTKSQNRHNKLNRNIRYFSISKSIYSKIILCDIIRKTWKCRKQTKMEGVTERHLPKTDESVVRPAGERL